MVAITVESLSLWAKPASQICSFESAATAVATSSSVVPTRSDQTFTPEESKALTHESTPPKGFTGVVPRKSPARFPATIQFFLVEVIPIISSLSLPEIVVLKNGSTFFGEKVAASAFGAKISEITAATTRGRLSFAHP